MLREQYLSQTDQLSLLWELYERKCAEESLYEFFKQAWNVIEGGAPFIDGWHIKAICEHLEAVVKGNLKKLIINVPPRTSKSSIISIAWPAWVWTTKPGTKFLYVSHSASLSNWHGRKCLNLIKSNWYQERWAHVFKLARDQIGKSSFANDKEGHRTSTSINAGTTGHGADILVWDDPNNAKDAYSDVKRNSTNSFFSNVWPSRMNPGGLRAQVGVQQRITEKDVTGYLSEQGDWSSLILPMEFENDRRSKTIILPSSNGKIWQDPRNTEGELLWPEGINEDDIKSLKKQQTTYEYAGQYQQRPAPAEGGMIKEAWFEKWKAKNPPSLIRIIQSLDTAFETKDINSYSAILTFGLFMHDSKESDDGIHSLILLNLWRGKLEYPDLRRLCMDVYDDYRNDGSVDITPDNNHQVDLMLVEAKANGISLVQDLRRSGINAHKFNPNKFGDKNSRVALASSLIREGLVHVPMMARNPERYRKISEVLIHHCKMFPNVESRDVVDCLTQIILYLMTSGVLRNPLDKNIMQTMKRGDKKPIYHNIDPL